MLGRLLTALLVSLLLGTYERFPYTLSQQIIADYEADTSGARNYYAAWRFSFIGDHAAAQAYSEKGIGPFATLSAADSAYFRTFKPADARKYILEQARNRQVVILNEAHHNAMHRVFTASLLEGLYRQGFRYFGAETLDHKDSLLNQRKYPVLETGFYTREPQYGNLVREALGIGYTLFAYETKNFGLSTPREREIDQARNIQQILTKDPKAKILIHCGYSHLQEDSLGGAWEKAMAGRLREFTGIDPFTINQEILSERSKPEMDNPFARMAAVQEPSVFVDAAGKAFNGPPGTKSFDVRVCHPRTTYRQGRPGWLFRGGAWKAHPVNTRAVDVGFPCLALAYKADENPSDAIPVDVIELAGPANAKPLVLPPGKYIVHLLNKDGKRQQMNIDVAAR
ncbi:MAG: hypothetical protein ICV83_09105 [Cytophagales bacterium]|nr:hypothetical protein [Cytophagales bacterium]